MVAILRLEDMKNWSVCDIFLKKQPEDEQEVIAILTAIRCNGKKLYFSDSPQGFLSPDWHICSTIGFKCHTGAIICDTGQTKSGISILFHQKLSQITYPMVHGEP